MSQREETGVDTNPVVAGLDQRMQTAIEDAEKKSPDVRLVRLRWEEDSDDFAAAVVHDGASLADVRLAITRQIQDERGILQDSYQFVCDGLPITSVQEQLIPITTVSSLTLRNLTETDDILRRGSVSKADQFLYPESRSTVSANDISVIIPASDDETNHPPVTPSQLTFPIRNHRSQDGRKAFLAKVHVSGQNVIEFHDILMLIRFLQNMREQKQHAVTWIDVQSAEAPELEQIGQSLQLHPLTIEDISVEHSRQKVEGFRQYMLVIFHGLPLPHEDRHYFESLSMIVSSSLVMTIHHAEVPTLDYVRRRLSRTYKNEIPCTATLVHAVADCIVDYDTLIVDESVQEVDSLEELVYILSQSEQTDLLRRMQLVRKRLTLLRQSLWSRRDIITQLMSREWRGFLTGVRVAYFRDVLDHVLTMIQKLELAQAMLDSLQSTYMAKVSIEVSEASNNINLVMKNISSFATAFLPMTFITGLWGMNVTVPFQTGSPEEKPVAFFVILASMFIGVIPFIYILKRLKWL